MGFKVPELTAQSKAPLDKGTWEVRFNKFFHGSNAAKDKDYVQPTFKVTDADAVDTDGEPYKRLVYGDRFWLTSNAMWRLKNFAEELEVEIPEAGEEFDSIGEYAGALTEQFSGLEGTISTDLEDYDAEVDGETVVKTKAVITEMNLG